MRTRAINTLWVRYAIAVLLVAPICTASAGSLPKKIMSSDGVQMVLVPAGEFIMGSNSGDDSEEPRRRVYIDGFYIDKYELTNARFRAAGMRTKKNYGPKFNGPKQPVVGVTWFEARDYCAKVGKRLPTEAEWEKAARGTDGLKYPWGNSWDPDKVIWRKNGGGKPHPVGRSYHTNESPYGAVDMAGNVWEWVHDGWSPEYYGKAPLRNPPGPTAAENHGGNMRMMRGASFQYKYATQFRAAYRGRSIPENRFDSRGFRCAKDLN